jgi:plastocyanin
MSRLRRAGVMVAVPLALLAGGCGGGSSGGGGGTTATSSPPTGTGLVVNIPIASSGFAFTTSTATASAGTVTLRAVNPQGVSHDISIKGNGVDAKGNQVSNGGASTVTVTLQPGTYEYYCSVPGHEQAGMKGTLTVS